MTIIALVTLYKPSISVVNNIRLLKKQVSKVILLDNTEDLDNSDMFNSVYGVEYIANKENLGLSQAFNKILRENETVLNSDYIVFFDQDSCVSENFIQTLITDFENINVTCKIGSIGSVYFDIAKNEYGGNSRLGTEVIKNCYEVTEVITSGLLTKYSILKEINFWNEKIFLDYADFDLCWRLKTKKYKCFISKNAILNHSLGVGVLKKRFLMKNLNMSYSPPLREYYQTREALKLLLKSYVPIRWKKNFLFNIIVRIWIFCKRLPDGKKRFRYYLQGINDAFLGINCSYKQNRQGD